jgi:hypothetical protein
VAGYEEHPAKAAAWREGRFVVFPSADTADCTALFSAEQATEGRVMWEGLLCRRLARDRALVCAMPFWVYDVGLGDEVALTESAEGAPVVTSVVTDAGSSIFRVFIDASADEDAWQRMMRDLEPFDCWSDVRTPRFLAIAAPPAHSQAVADYLQEREQHGDIQYETGRSSSS